VHDDDDFDRMASALGSHPDFRILRRMPTGRFDVVAPTGGDTRKVAVVDVETTGLNPERDKIIEFAAIVFEVDPATSAIVSTVDAYEEFEDPGFPIPAEVTAINGITDSDVAGRRLGDARLASMFPVSISSSRTTRVRSPIRRAATSLLSRNEVGMFSHPGRLEG